MILNFVDIIILKRLKEAQLSSGYDVMQHLNRRFRFLPSPGTVYSALYSLERQNLIEARTDQGKTTYKLTKRGEEHLKSISCATDTTKAFFSYLFSGH
jgi:DNA-binding PadR family transcriptional regulator